MFVRPGHFHRSLFRRLASLFAIAGLAVVLSVPALAAVASRIIVEGNQRIGDDTVIGNLTIQPGQNYTGADVDDSIDALFATGLFEDVTITPSGNTLIVRVVENAVISRVNFEGNRRISDQVLESVTRSSARSVLRRSTVQSDVQRILAVYRGRGSFSASVEPQIIDRGQGRVDLIFEITEGANTSVARISFIGNRSFSDGRLRDVIKTKESGLLGFIRKTDTYDPNRLQEDQQALRRFYFNRGFADFRIISANADFDRERNEFFITFNIEEGDRYEFGDVRVETTLSDLDPEDLRRDVESRPGRRYSAEDIEKSLEELTLEANRQGYPFAQVVPTGERNFETGTIDVVYRIDQGVQGFIERIEIIGNETTRDYVIRREFDIAEGDAFNRILLDRAERRLRNLGFFENVQITTTRGSAPDRVVVVVRVEEKATGSVQFGVGYSTNDGVVGDISYEQRNFLGRGQYIKAGFGGGAKTQNAEFSFTEPYLFGRRLAGGFDVFHRQSEDANGQNYDTQETGGSLRLTVPLTENFATQIYYTLFNRDVSVPTGVCPGGLSAAVCDSVGERLTSLVGVSLVYNTLDNQLQPREGIYLSNTTEIAGLGGDAAFIRDTAKARYYQEIIPAYGVVGMVGLEGGAILSLNDDLKIQDQFQIGGTVIRGFQTGGLGPRDATTGEALGGRFYVAATAEATFPIPFIPPEVGLNGAFFADAGSLWGVDPDIANTITQTGGQIVSDDFDLRAAAGVGVLWNSPFGPIRADFAFPFLENNADRTQVFRLSGGTRF
ncbi:MAG: outer membrane protein assembly factor BamA [Pseudomonadota bacterium]